MLDNFDDIVDTISELGIATEDSTNIELTRKILHEQEKRKLSDDEFAELIGTDEIGIKQLKEYSVDTDTLSIVAADLCLL